MVRTTLALPAVMVISASVVPGGFHVGSRVVEVLRPWCQQVKLVNSNTVGIERTARNKYLEFWTVGANSEARFVFVLLYAHRNRSIWGHFNIDRQDVADDAKGDLLFRGVQILQQLRDLANALMIDRLLIHDLTPVR